jgi:hypothetical protein
MLHYSLYRLIILPVKRLVSANLAPKNLKPGIGWNFIILSKFQQLQNGGLSMPRSLFYFVIPSVFTRELQMRLSLTSEITSRWVLLLNSNKKVLFYYLCYEYWSFLYILFRSKQGMRKIICYNFTCVKRLIVFSFYWQWKVQIK